MKKGAIWIHVVDDLQNDIPLAPAMVGNVKYPTSKFGIAAVGQVDPAIYTVDLGPLGDLEANYCRPTGPTRHPVQVSNGEITYVAYELPRKAQLTVQLVHSKDENHRFAGAMALVRGFQPAPTNAQTGLAPIGKVKPGKYWVKAAVSREDAKYFLTMMDEEEIVLGPGEVRVVTLYAYPLAKPLIEAPVKAVSIVRVSCPVVRQTVVLKADQEFPDAGVLTCASPDVAIYYEGVKVEAVGNVTTLRVASVGNGVAIEVEGRKPTALDAVELVWKLDPENIMAAPDAVTARMTVVDAMLTVFDRDGKALTPAVKRGDGRVIHVQNAAKERKRAKLSMYISPKEYVGRLVLTAKHANVEVYAAETGGAALALPLEFEVGPGKRLPVLWVEGTSVSWSKADTGFTLGIAGLTAEADRVNFTVVEAQAIVHHPWIDRTKWPDPLDEDKKANPGRELYLQGPQRRSKRACLWLSFQPVDAPCEVVVTGSGDHLRLLNVEDPTLTAVPAKSIEADVDYALPVTIPAANYDPVNGIVVYVEGAKLTNGAISTLQLGIPGVEDCVDTVGFTVVQSKLTIDIKRDDGRPLNASVMVNLKDKPADPIGTLMDYFDDKPISFELPPGLHVVALEALGNENLMQIVRTLPADSMEAVVVVGEVPEVRVEFEYRKRPKYNYIQFIGYQIETGAYLGADSVAKNEAEARKDIVGRAQVMREAVQTALVSSEKSRDTLKVFVAPEFYFRGKFGAYPLELMNEVALELRKESNKKDYEDWIFAFGSVLGYLQLSEPDVRPNVTAVTVKAPTGFCISCKQKPVVGDSIGAYNSVTKAFPVQTITNVVELGPGLYQITPAYPAALGANDALYLWDVAKGKSVAAPTSTLIPGRIKEIRGKFTGADLPVGAVLTQGVNKGYVIAATVLTATQDCTIYADFPSAVSGVDIQVAIRGESEVFNVVPIQMGGTGTPLDMNGGTEVKDLLIYKEAVSWVDFAGMDKGQTNFYEVFRHLIQLHGEEVRVIPTEGATDMLGKAPNVLNQPKVGSADNATEVNKTGLGGGAIFDMAGFKFGVDVCLDHANGRLKATGQKVHLHLIPSCGMSIDNTKISVVPEGFVFNVDGQAGGAAHTKLQKETVEIPKPAKIDFEGTSRATYFAKKGEIYVYTRQEKLW